MENTSSEEPKVTTQLPDANDGDVTTEEVPIATTEETPENNVTKIPGTSDDTAAAIVDKSIEDTSNDTIEDVSNAGCEYLIEEFEVKENQLKQYYKNGHETKVTVLIIVFNYNIH